MTSCYSISIFLLYEDIRWHVGASPVHCPLGRHNRGLIPTNPKPVVHLYVAVEPTLFPLSVTLPFTGSARSGQLTAAD